MSRFYVEHNGLWNVYSTIIEDFCFCSFMKFDKLKSIIMKEKADIASRELDSLLTSKPELNKMSYEEAMERLKFREGC